MQQSTRLDRIVTLESPIVSRDSYGGEIITWLAVVTVWANKRPLSAKERFIATANRRQATRRAVWRIRYRSDINELWRVVDAQRRIWGVEGITKASDNKWLDLWGVADTSRLP